MDRSWSRKILVIVMMAMLLMAACGGQPSNSGTPTNTGGLDPNKRYTVNFWEAFATGANKISLEALTRRYMQLHPNVDVKLQAYDSYPTLKTKLTAAIAAGNPPTIAQVYENWANQYQQSGALVSLQPFITGKNGLSQQDLQDFYPSLLQDGQIGGVQYEMPFNKSDEVLYYNVDALQRLGIAPPTTFQELEADLTKVTKADGSRWGLSFTPSSDEWSILYKLFGGGDFVTADGKHSAFASGANGKAAQQALGELAPLVKSGAVHITQNFNWQNDFASQKSLFAISTIASYPFIVQAAANAFKLMEVPLPPGPAGQFTVLFGTNLSLFSGASSDSLVAGWDYMKYLTGFEAGAAFVRETGYMPVRKSVFDSSNLQDYYGKVPARKAGPQSLKFAFVASIIPAWDQCRDIITTNFIATLNGQSQADAALTKTASACDSALAQG
ncbi:MAG TPA: ABC transporter substrate-binding protein [Ktedonobacteraceae bacterium]|nr:ABC transporter substrate-binding protein [Ktedonobacteraceae bacterium]